jgi:hypothetical protein
LNRKKEPAAESAAAPNQIAFGDIAIERFKDRFGQKPTWSAKDYRQLAELRKVRPDLSLDELERRYLIMLDAKDSFIEGKCGSLAYFCSHFDEFIEPIRRNDYGTESKAERRTRKNIQAAREFLEHVGEVDVEIR